MTDKKTRRDVLKLAGVGVIAAGLKPAMGAEHVGATNFPSISAKKDAPARIRLSRTLSFIRNGVLWGEYRAIAKIVQHTGSRPQCGLLRFSRHIWNAEEKLRTVGTNCPIAQRGARKYPRTVRPYRVRRLRNAD